MSKKDIFKVTVTKNKEVQKNDPLFGIKDTVNFLLNPVKNDKQFRRDLKSAPVIIIDGEIKYQCIDKNKNEQSLQALEQNIMNAATETDKKSMQDLLREMNSISQKMENNLANIGKKKEN